MKSALQRREGAQPAMFPEPEHTPTPSLHVCRSALSLYTRGERRRWCTNKQSSFSSILFPRFPRRKPHPARRYTPATRTSLKRGVAIPSGSLTAGILPGGGLGGMVPSRQESRCYARGNSRAWRQSLFRVSECGAFWWRRWFPHPPGTRRGPTWADPWPTGASRRGALPSGNAACVRG